MSTTGSGKKPVRRVRVIEILDDEELDEAAVEAVLAAADAAEAEETAAEAEETAAVKAAEAEETAKAEEPADAVEAVEPVTLLKAEEAEEGEAPEKAGGAEKSEKPEKSAKPERHEGAGKKAAGPSSGLAARVPVLLTAAVVVLALLAGFALLQWRSADGVNKERKELIARVTEFGDVMATYSYDDVESSNEKAMSYLTGDALEERRKVDLAALKKQLEAQKTKLESKTYAVYVGSIDGNLAGAVLVFDLKGESTALSAPQTISKSHLTLGLIKRDGRWMISSMVPAGSENATSQAPAGTTVPSATPSPSPSEKKGEKN